MPHSVFKLITGKKTLLHSQRMGACSSCISKGVSVATTLLGTLGLNFTSEEWSQAHNTGTIEDGTTQLWSLGTDLKKTDDSNLPSSVAKACYICCNTYTREDYSLGVGPMNDAITVATYLKDQGITIYFIHNPTSQEYIKYLKYFLEHTTQELICYYTGHGGSISDDNGDEADKKDEALVFDDAFVRDDVLSDVLEQYKTGDAKVILINDCCHSGTIWDLEASNFKSKAPTNVMSLSAARDSETAKQTSVGGTDQGIFTFYLFKIIQNNPSLTPNQIKTEISSYLKKFEQEFTANSTTSSLLDQKVFI